MGKWRGPPHEEILRCGAKTRSGGFCGHYAMRNGRCRYHGGKATGARNPHRPLKHGHYTREAIEQRRKFANLLKDSYEFLNDIE